MSDVITRDCLEILQRVSVDRIRGQRVLITGANGLLGQYLLSALAQANRVEDAEIRIDAVSLSESSAVVDSIVKQDPHIDFRRVDLSRPFDLSAYDCIFHAAGYGQPARFVKDPASTVSVNVDAAVSLMESSPNGIFVYFSSAEVYGDIPSELLPVSEEFNGNPPLHAPRSVYAEAKRLGEALCAAYRSQRGSTAKIVRISHVYGPGLPASDRRVMSDFIRRARTNGVLELMDDGRAVKTYGYIADVVSMILFVALHAEDMVYNVGGIDTISVLDLARRIAAHFNIECKVPPSARALAHVGMDPPVVRLDLTKVRHEMDGFSLTPFSEGLSRTIEWGAWAGA